MTVPRIWPHHLEELRASGLSAEMIAAARIRSVTNAEATALIGFGRSAGYAIPYLHTATDGAEPFTRVKFDKPGTNGRRYAQAKGSGNRLYIPPDLDPATLKDPTITLYITEGEKKSLKAVQEGLACVSVSGVDSWRSRVDGKSRPIADLDRIAWKGRETFIVYDSDVEMKERVQWAEYQLAQELTRRGAKVLAVRLPAGPDGKKVGLDDYLMTHSVEAFCQLEPVPIARPSRSRTDGTRRLAVVTEHLTDLGNARRLVTLHRDDLRYCHPWGTWLVWDGKRWRRDATGEAVRRAKDTVRAMYAEAAAERDEELREILGVHALRSEAEARIRAMLALAESEPGIPVEPGDLDRDPWAFNVLNGTFDLRTGALRPHRREDLISLLAPVEYDPAARAPTWEAFLRRVLAGNEALERYLQRAVGHALTGDVREQVLQFLHGSGANGKTTFVKAVLEALGDYGRQAAPDLLVVKYGNEHPAGLADLRGARFVASVEVEEGKRLAEVLVKQLTGGDRLKARFMRENFFEFEATFKLFLIANHKPVIRGTDIAIWRRIRLVPFTVAIPEPEQDRGLPEKLRGELAGVLAWAVRGCLAWQQEGLRAPAEVLAATQEYRAESDVIGPFLDERCVLDPALWISSGALRAAYVSWCQKTGEHPVSAQMFGRRLAERGLTDRRGSGGIRGWNGIGLVSDG